LDTVEKLDRHEEPVGFRVLQLQVLALGAVELFQDHAVEAGDAVVDVDHQLARLELETDGWQAPPGPAAPDHRPANAPEELVVGQDREPKTGVLGTHRQVCLRLLDAGGEDGVKVEIQPLGLPLGAGFGEQCLETLRLFAGEHDRRALGDDLAQRARPADQWFRLVPAQVESVLRLARRDADALPPSGREPLGRHHRRLEARRQLPVGRLGSHESGRLAFELSRLGQLALGLEIDDQGILGQVVEERRQGWIDVGGVELNTREGRAHPEPDELVLPVGADVASEVVEIARPAQPGDRGGASSAADDDLAPGTNRHPGHPHHRALVARVEQTQALDLVPEELGANRGTPGGGKHVENSAPHGELARLLHQGLARVAEVGEAPGKPVQAGAGPGRELDRGRGEELGRERRPHGGSPRGDEQAGLGAGAERGKRFKPPADRGVDGRRPVEEGDPDLSEEIAGRPSGQPGPNLGQEAIRMPDQDEGRPPPLEGAPGKGAADNRPGARRQPPDPQGPGRHRFQHAFPERPHGISSQSSEPCRLYLSMAAWTPTWSASSRASTTPERTLSSASASRFPKRPST